MAQALMRSGEPAMVTYTRPGSDVAPGSVVVIGSIAGVDICGGAANETGAAAISGVFEVVKVGEHAFTVGQTVYWNATASPIGGESSSGAATGTVEDYVLGVCVGLGAEDGETVLVDLQQYAIASS